MPKSRVPPPLLAAPTSSQAAERFVRNGVAKSKDKQRVQAYLDAQLVKELKRIKLEEGTNVEDSIEAAVAHWLSVRGSTPQSARS